MTIITIPKILVVNDDKASLVALTSVLAPWCDAAGCAIHSARSGPEALRQVLENEFAVILLDVKMPEMDGFETAQAIHSRTISSSIPIIFVTAFAADELSRLKAYQQGAVDYLFTPVVPQMLIAKVSAFVTLAKRNMELENQTAKLTAINQRLELEISQREIADKKNRAKDYFLAMLGHELRNPLSAIASASKVMDIPNANQDTLLRARQIIQRQSQHLTHIVDDLLDLARVMEGKIVLHAQSIDLAAAVERCLDTLAASARTEAHVVNLDVEDKVWIAGDPTRIEQILINLIDNALKYTNPGGTIDVHLAGNEEWAVLTIRDTGIGIESDLIAHIFDVFVQSEDSIKHARGGLGIGLALVRQLINLHGGSITAASEGLGRGSSFTVRLPAIPEPVVPAVLNCTAELKRDAPGRHVLLIEDNDDGRVMLEELLSSYGYIVHAAPDGASGLRLAAEEIVDIVIVDIGLPDMSGYEVAAQLRQASQTKHLRLIALSGFGREMDVQNALEAGFNLHLLKPVDSDVLLSALKSSSNVPLQ